MAGNKKLSALFTLFLSAAGAHAGGLSVIGPCSAEPVFESSFEIGGSSVSAGKVSEDVFAAAGVPYTGDGDGLLSIMDSPSGAAAVEVVSGSEMRVYGWCYAVNGSTPSVMPGAFFLHDNTARVVWFYAYSAYKEGVWGDSCLPSYEVRPHQFCAATRAGAPLSGDIAPALRPAGVLRGMPALGAPVPRE
ncbi:MAG: hypothetical protein CVU79_01180 [Elusimicrobia bacterium HGW-Elusimicrobia-3]|nr:MAG: hypothetical protein CVU79_01180 [Elusimicrobia bacterium HGW-Elusimicrobia-3]